MSLKTLFTSAFLISVVVLPAFAQDSDMQALVDRLERMDRDIKALNLKVYRSTNAPSTVAAGEDVSGPLGARLSIRINELENQLRQMTGQIEETAFRISQLTTRLDKLVADVDYRLTTLEGGNPALVQQQSGAANALGGEGQPVEGLPTGVSGQQLLPPVQGQAEGGQAAPTETQVATVEPVTQPVQAAQTGVLGTLNGKDLETPTVTEQPQASVPPVQTAPVQSNPVQATPVQQTPVSAPQETQVATLTPEAQYESARQMLMRGEFVSAENSFKGFLQENGDHKLTGNVRYWLGETYYVQGNYAQAAATFLEGYQKDTRGAKAPDSLLKLGMSLKRMDKQREACATFGKLRADFPKMPAHLSKTLERERTAAQCS